MSDQPKDWTLTLAIMLAQDPETVKGNRYGKAIQDLMAGWRADSKADGSEDTTGFYVLGWNIEQGSAEAIQDWVTIEGVVALKEGAPVITKGAAFEKLMELFEASRDDD